MCSKSVSYRGFTLLELLVVIVLISLVTSFAIPTIRTNLYSDPLRATARRLVGLMTEVSQEAVSNQSEFVIHFDLEHNQIWAVPASSGSNDEALKEIRLNIPESITVVDVSSFHGGKTLDDTVKLAVSKKGYVDKTAIHLRSEDGRDMTVILSPFMGVTRVFDSYIDLEDDQARL